MSLGKGGNLANESGFRDLRNDDVMVLRPLRDVPGKELALYAQYHRLNSFTDTVLGTGKDFGNFILNVLYKALAQLLYLWYVV